MAGAGGAESGPRRRRPARGPEAAGRETLFPGEARLACASQRGGWRWLRRNRGRDGERLAHSHAAPPAEKVKRAASVSGRVTAPVRRAGWRAS